MFVDLPAVYGRKIVKVCFAYIARPIGKPGGEKNEVFSLASFTFANQLRNPRLLVFFSEVRRLVSRPVEAFVLYLSYVVFQ